VVELRIAPRDIMMISGWIRHAGGGACPAGCRFVASRS
jgi:hypothetical protein